MKIFVCTFLGCLLSLKGLLMMDGAQVSHWTVVPIVAFALATVAQAFEVILPSSWVKWLDEFRL